MNDTRQLVGAAIAKWQRVVHKSFAEKVCRMSSSLSRRMISKARPRSKPRNSACTRFGTLPALSEDNVSSAVSTSES